MATGGHKLGPREIRHQGDHGMLASEAAGIAPMTAQQSAQLAQQPLFQPHYDLKGITTTNVAGHDRYGHHVENTGGAGYGGHKLGPREIRNQGDHTQLASVAAGIAPMTAAQSASYDPNELYKPMRYDTKGLTTTDKSQHDRYGHHKAGGGGGGGGFAHKQGPREIGHSHGMLASEAAGIKPMTAADSQRRAQEGSFQPHYDTKGLTTTALSQKNLHHGPGRGRDIFGATATAGGRKQGPREIGHANQQLASEAAGIKPMHASQAAHNSNLFQARHDTKGFTAMH